eukprot:2041476-Alexandrium_andersonii.AAC.1
MAGPPRGPRPQARGPFGVPMGPKHLDKIRPSLTSPGHPLEFTWTSTKAPRSPTRIQLEFTSASWIFEQAHRLWRRAKSTQTFIRAAAPQA